MSTLNPPLSNGFGGNRGFGNGQIGGANQLGLNGVGGIAGVNGATFGGGRGGIGGGNGGGGIGGGVLGGGSGGGGRFGGGGSFGGGNAFNEYGAASGGAYDGYSGRNGGNGGYNNGYGGNGGYNNGNGGYGNGGGGYNGGGQGGSGSFDLGGGITAYPIGQGPQNNIDNENLISTEGCFTCKVQRQNNDIKHSFCVTVSFIMLNFFGLFTNNFFINFSLTGRIPATAVPWSRSCSISCRIRFLLLPFSSPPPPT